jgi:hypothetical protein
LLELSLGDWANPDGKKKLQNWLYYSKKKWPLFGRARSKNYNFSVSAHVLRRKPTRKPAQKPAVILYANK